MRIDYRGKIHTDVLYIIFVDSTPKKNICLQKTYQLLDRLTYCEPPPFGGEAMWQDVPIIITD